MTLETFFPYKLAIAAETFSRNLSQVYGRAYGLSREEWRLLFLLADMPKITSRELSQRTTLDKVQVSRAAKRLEEKGFVTRAIEQDDRRLRRYKITDTGRALFDKAIPEVEARTQEILGSLSPQNLAALTQGLEALQAAATQRLREDDA